ncbi:MAG TPA: metalloregulator ArsR/SmtB family transcription factor [Anaerolineales bacterium]|nr:metalloregulator ArsR/SmtB family transcription factor [Anaerolineales bacterium]
MVSSTLVQEIIHFHADFCSALADSTRLILLYALAESPRNVTELTQELGYPQPTISRHLKHLRDRGLVIATRQGMTVQYSLADQRVIEALDILRSIQHDSIQRRASLIEELVED